MNCSARELGLGNDHDGIMILPADAPVGIPFAEYAGMSDTVLDLEITPNRPDCLSMVGMAREVGAMYRADVTLPIYELEEDAKACPMSPIWQPSRSKTPSAALAIPRVSSRTSRSVPARSGWLNV